jgi:outer membrane protein OmpA-like peptidoglycan-associated protein
MVASVALLLVGACAGSKPPDTLVRARQQYDEAEHSQAARYTPAALHDARTALESAESLYKNDEDAKLVNDAAYVAMRRSERAKIEGETLALQTRKEQLLRNEQQAQAKSVQESHARLQEARGELEKERAARAAADARASESMEKLQHAASVQEKASGTVITVSGALLFPSGKADLIPGSEAALDEIADALKEQGDRRILIRGFTDSSGSDRANLALSKARAAAVANYVASRDVPRDKIRTEGMGEADPVAPNSTPAGRAANRRVEIEVEHAPPQ